VSNCKDKTIFGKQTTRQHRLFTEELEYDVVAAIIFLIKAYFRTIFLIKVPDDA